MKRVMLFMVLAALLLTQCKKPSIEFPTPSVTTTVNMTITAGPGSKTDITTEGGIVWSEGDKIYVGDGAKCIGCLSIVSGVGYATGTFTGDVTATAGDDCTFHFYYLGSTAAPDVDATEVTIDFSSQDIYADGGKLKNASKHHVGYGKAENVTVAAGQPITGLQVDMKSKVAIAYFCFESGTETPTPYRGALTLSGENIYNKMTVKFNESDFYFTPVKDGDISLTNTTTHLKYAMLVPTGSTAEEILNFGGVVTGSTTLANGIEANKFYRVDGSMPIVVPLAHGMVNFGAPNLNWSVCNLGATNGATKESWYGDYYAWGATETWYSAGGQTSSPTWKSGYSEGYVWKHCPGNGGKTSYNSAAFGPWKDSNLTNNNVLNSDVDAATANWGDGWRMPTSAEWEALYNNNTFEWLDEDVTSTNVTDFTAVASGYLVVKGGKKSVALDASVYMFLPAAGYRYQTGLDEAGYTGYYWSSSLFSTDINAYDMKFTEDLLTPPVGYSRCRGLTVRPVR